MKDHSFFDSYLNKFQSIFGHDKSKSKAQHKASFYDLQKIYQVQKFFLDSHDRPLKYGFIEFQKALGTLNKDEISELLKHANPEQKLVIQAAIL